MPCFKNPTSVIDIQGISLGVHYSREWQATLHNDQYLVYRTEKLIPNRSSLLLSTTPNCPEAPCKQTMFPA